MDPSIKNRAPSEFEGNIIPFFIVGLILLLLGPGLIFASIGIFIDQGAEFSFWGDHGPDHPDFAGDVIWEGTSDDEWTANLYNDGGELRVWIEEGKSIDLNVSLYGDNRGADFYRCDAWECDYFNNANESIPGYEFIGIISVWKNSTYTVQFTSTEDNNETVMVIVTREILPIPGIALIGMMTLGLIVTYVIIKLTYHTTREIRREASTHEIGESVYDERRSFVSEIDGTRYGPGFDEFGDDPKDWRYGVNIANEFWICYLGESREDSFVQYSCIEGMFEHWEGGEMVHSEKGDSDMAFSYYAKVRGIVAEEGGDDSKEWWTEG